MAKMLSHHSSSI